MACGAVGESARQERKERRRRALAAAEEAPDLSEAALAAARIRVRYLAQLGISLESQRSESRCRQGRGPRLSLEAVASLTSLDSDEATAPRLPPELARGDCRMAFLRTLAYQRVWVPRVHRPVSHQTISIFDWDDTLLCTTYLETFMAEGCVLSKNLRAQLRGIARAGARLLELAMQSGQTLIVTNALEGWVEKSAAEYLPELLPLLRYVQVISARSHYEERFPGQFTAWKRSVFYELRRKMPPSALANVVVLGDSRFEISAAMSLKRTFGNTTVKAIKFKEEPSPSDLLSQLQVVTKRFPDIVGAGQSTSRRLYQGTKIVGQLGSIGGA